jgi:hypothetical protein
MNPFTSLPTVTIPCSGMRNRGNTGRVLLPAERGRNNYHYVVVLHPEPVCFSFEPFLQSIHNITRLVKAYGTIETDSASTFEELHVPSLSKINSFIDQAKQLHLAFDYELSAKSTNSVTLPLHAALETHLLSHEFAFSTHQFSPSSSSSVLAAQPWNFLVSVMASRKMNLGPLLHEYRQPLTKLTHGDLRSISSRWPTYNPASGPHRTLIFIRKHLVLLHNCS